MEVPAIVRGSRVPAGEADKGLAKEVCSSTVHPDPTRRKRERESSPKTEKDERGGPKQGHAFSNALYPPSNSGESAIPESRATRATTSPIARD